MSKLPDFTFEDIACRRKEVVILKVKKDIYTDEMQPISLPSGSLSNHMLEIPEELVLDPEKDFLYLSDPKTYELYFLSGKLPPNLEHYKNAFHGRKCYEILQERSEPCPFCTNDQLSENRYHIWQHYNSLSKRNYILEDKLIKWQRKLVRLEVCRDITEPGRAVKILRTLLEDQDILTSCVSELAQNSDIESALNAILANVKAFFNAERTSFYFFKDDKLIHEMADGACRSPFHEIFHNKKDWMHFFHSERQLYIDAPEELRDLDPDLYFFLKKSNIFSFCVTPIILSDKPIGVLDVVNSKAHLGGFPLLKSLCVDISTHIQAQILKDNNQRILYYDEVAECANFLKFKQSANLLLDENPSCKYAIWSCDIIKFRYVNDIFGFHTGDLLLKYWSQILKNTCNAAETFCRVSADNFVLLCQYTDIDMLEKRYNNDAQRLRAFPELLEKEFRPQMTAGVYLIDSPADRIGLEEMIDRANIARRRSHNKPDRGFFYYSEEMRKHDLQNLQLEAGLENALKTGELIPYFQPQVSLQGRHFPARAEALVRWRASDGSILMPASFIELFEMDGKIVEVDAYIFETVCNLLCQWHAQSLKSIIVAVNVSRVSLFQPDFIERYCGIKEKYGIPDGILELELTENIAVKNFELFGTIVNKLRQKGFLCAMDDFGSGNSSLNVLMNIPFDVLKLDRQFFLPCDCPERRNSVIRCILRLAEELNLQVVAEGVESLEQVNQLVECGCDFIQCFLFAKPMPEKDFTKWLQKQSENDDLTNVFS